MTTLVTDAEIRQAAINRYGCVDASVVRQSIHNEQREDGGVWFVLSIDRGDGMEVICRRRTKAELWQLVHGNVRPAGNAHVLYQ